MTECGQIWKKSEFATDNGMEYVDGSFGKFLSELGIRYQTFWTYTPRHNGLAERKNRQIMNVARASLFGMNMPRFYCAEAVKSVAYLINRMPSRAIDFQTPDKKWNRYFQFLISQIFNDEFLVMLFMSISQRICGIHVKTIYFCWLF